MIVISQEIIEVVGKLKNSPEKVISFLKDSGFSKTHPMIAYSKLMNVSPIIAKKAIHFSDVWSGNKNLDKVIQEKLFNINAK